MCIVIIIIICVVIITIIIIIEENSCEHIFRNPNNAADSRLTMSQGALEHDNNKELVFSKAVPFWRPPGADISLFYSFIDQFRL